MNIIVAVDKNWSIGNKGQLLVSIPEDKKLFREETMGKGYCHGTKDPGEPSWKAAALWKDQRCFDQKSGLQSERSSGLPQPFRGPGRA